MSLSVMSITVAPPAGAWIETLYYVFVSNVYYVAPPAGAWIETSLYISSIIP